MSHKSIQEFHKLVSERKDYDYDFTGWLEGDTIVDVQVGVQPSGITTQIEFTTTTVKIWCEGGIGNASYEVKITVTTDLTRVEIQKLVVHVEPD